MRAFQPRLLKGFLLVSLLPIQLAHGESTPPSDGETPASLACVYGLTPHVKGCPISGTTIVPKKGSGIIAVIEGASDPKAYKELKAFSKQWGLYELPKCKEAAPPCFETYYAKTCKAVGDVGAGDAPPLSTDLEPEIDFEWAHAMAPYASIYVIESESWQFEDIIKGVDCANKLLREKGGGIVSISVSYDEFPNESNFDSHFQEPGVIYFSSAGDYSAPARYPASSPYVIAAGGTMIERDYAGNFLRQVAWHNSQIPCTEKPCKTGGSGGPSLYETRPSYQNSVQKIVGKMRGTPDISFVAQQVDIFCCLLQNSSGTNQCPAPSTSCPADGQWVKTGGTSLASPALAGVINAANSGARSSKEELKIIYNGAVKNYHQYWSDIIIGNNGYPAMQGYDFATGLGVPRGYGGK